MALPGPARMRGQFKDHSGTIAAANVSQSLAPSNPNRNYLFIQNHHATGDLWVAFSQPATVGQPSIRIAAGADLTFEGSFLTIEDIAVISSTNGLAFTAKEG